MNPRQRGQGTCSTQVSFTCYHSTHLKGGVGCGALGCIDRTGNETYLERGWKGGGIWLQDQLPVLKSNQMIAGIHADFGIFWILFARGLYHLQLE